MILRAQQLRSVPNQVVMSLSLGSVLLAGRIIEPATIPGVCIFRWLTGIPCMFCGLTHAFHAISIGQFAEAFRYHPLGLLAYALVLFHFITSSLRMAGWQHPRLLPWLDTRTMMVSVFVIYTAAWVIQRAVLL